MRQKSIQTIVFLGFFRSPRGQKLPNHSVFKGFWDPQGPPRVGETLKTLWFGSFCDPPGTPRRVVLNSSFTGVAVWPVRLNPGALAVVGCRPGARPGVKSSQTRVFSNVFGTPRATQPSNHLGNTMVWSVFNHFRYLRATPDASGEAWGSPAPRTLPARLNPEQRVER